MLQELLTHSSLCFEFVELTLFKIFVLWKYNKKARCRLIFIPVTGLTIALY